MRAVVYHGWSGYGRAMGLGAEGSRRWAELVRFGREDLWSHDVYRHGSRSRRAGLLVLRTLYLVWLGFSRERLRLRAAALTYMTLLSLVPALTVVFAVFAGFAGLSDARERLRDEIVGLLSVTHREAVTAYLDRFVGSVGAIGGVGVVILLFTTLSLLSTIERSFNDIWGLEEDRGWVRRFQAYWPLLTLAPVLMGVSLTVTASVESSDTWRMIVDTVPGARLVARLGPLFLTWLGFALMYLIMPNTRVPVRYALIGGVVAGTMWEVAKGLYAVYAARAITYSAIYGSLGVVPLSIIWVYVSWLVALTGAQLTFASQNARSWAPESDDPSGLAAAVRERLAVRLALAVYGGFEAGLGPQSASRLLAHVPGPPREKRSLLDLLAEAGLLVRTEHRDGGAFAPARPADRVSLADVRRAVRGEAAPLAPGLEPDAIDRLLDTAEAEGAALLDRTSLAGALAQTGGAAAAAPSGAQGEDAA
jgi:membrane protein